jgi:hypothetical protein
VGSKYVVLMVLPRHELSYQGVIDIGTRRTMRLATNCSVHSMFIMVEVCIISNVEHSLLFVCG